MNATYRSISDCMPRMKSPQYQIEDSGHVHHSMHFRRPRDDIHEGQAHPFKKDMNTTQLLADVHSKLQNIDSRSPSKCGSKSPDKGEVGSKSYNGCIPFELQAHMEKLKLKQMQCSPYKQP